MGTSSTIPAVKSRLVEVLSAVMDVPVTYAWPGPNAAHECVFLGRYPDVQGEDRVDARSEIANVVAGRKQRTETYTLPVTVWSFRPDLNSDGAEEAEARAFVLLAELEDVLADDPTLGVDIQWARLGDYSSVGHPFDKGWVYELIAQVDVQARLT
jgi:hypothetical protein